MVYNNPVTAAPYFFTYQLIRREVLSRGSYPVSFIKWYFSKFEFQGRGTIHEHTLKKLVYLFLSKERREEIVKLTKDERTYNYRNSCFVLIDVHVLKLSVYTSTKKIAELLVSYNSSL